MERMKACVCVPLCSPINQSHSLAFFVNASLFSLSLVHHHHHHNKRKREKETRVRKCIYCIGGFSTESKSSLQSNIHISKLQGQKRRMEKKRHSSAKS